MRNKETYATSGPRIKLRMFGGYDYSSDMLRDADMISKAYASGVPMGGDLKRSDTAPSFLVWAMRDPRNAPLQRLQMIKVMAKPKKSFMILPVLMASKLTWKPIAALIMVQALIWRIARFPPIAGHLS